MNIYNKPKEENGSWSILVVNEDTLESVKTLTFKTEEEANEAYKKQIDKNAKEQHKNRLEMERKEVNSFGDSGLGSLFGLGDGGSMSPSEQLEAQRVLEEKREEGLKEHEEEFTKNENECNNKARQLLISVADLYLKNKVITNDNYIKTKIEIESASLASLIFQLHTTRKAIYKLSEKIHLGEATPRHYEVLTGLNRIVLDITKYQREYIKDIEESMKQTFLDFNEMGTGTEDESIDVSKNSGLRLNDKKKLIQEIRSYLLETKDDRKIPRSKNAKLDSDDPNIVDIEYSEEKVEESDEFEIKNGGLDTF